MDSMFRNSATHFSLMIESSSAAPVTPVADDASPGTVAYALFRCVCASASFPVALYASARISSFSTYVTYGTRASSAKRAGRHMKFEMESWVTTVLKSSPPYGWPRFLHVTWLSAVTVPVVAGQVGSAAPERLSNVTAVTFSTSPFESMIFAPRAYLWLATQLAVAVGQK